MPAPKSRWLLRCQATGEVASWHSAELAAEDPEAAIREVISSWRGSVASSLSEQRGAAPRPRFGLAFVPRHWGGKLRGIVDRLVRECRWPRFAPFVGSVTEADSLSLCTSVAIGGQALGSRAPRTFFLSRRKLDSISKAALNPELRSTNTMKINGTVLAAHACIGIEPQDVGGLFLLADPSAGSRLIGRALALLDVAYPGANKVGLVAARPGNDPALALGHRGAIDESGVLVLSLPGPLHSAINLCGCEPLGEPMEVHEADFVHGGFIRTLGGKAWDTDDGPSWGVPGVVTSAHASFPPRRRSIPAAVALREAASKAGRTHRSDIWVGVPRGSARDVHVWRAAPGAGEWSLYPWSATTSEGTVVLGGEGPAADGLVSKGLRRIQPFVARLDSSSIKHMAQAYHLERQVRDFEGARAGAPYGSLLVAGGPGAIASVSMSDQRGDFGGCSMGAAVIGRGGLRIEQAGLQGTGTFSYSSVKLSPTCVHQQSAGIVYFCN